MKLIHATAALLLAAAPLATIPAASAAAGDAYVALGDSYSAGNGTYSSTGSCYRGTDGYARLIASRNGWNLSYQACSGAVINDVVANQLGALSTSTRYVTVSAGGNDAGFAPALTECAKPGWLSNCPAALDRAAGVVSGTIPGRLDTLYGQIRTKAPNARRVAVGYPRLMNGDDCNLLTFFSPSEQSRMNQITDQLDNLVGAKAAAYGMAFADPRSAFSGHAVCDSSAYINGLTLPIEEAFHPNDAGNRAYATVVSAKLGVASAYSTRTTSGTAAAKAPTAQDYAKVLPGLASDANLRKAERGGIPRATIVRLDKDLRSGDIRRARAAMAQLQQLDAQYERTH